MAVIALAVLGIALLVPEGDLQPEPPQAVEVQSAKPLQPQRPRLAAPAAVSKPKRELPRLAAGWRAAIKQNNDQAIMHCALELRLAPDGREQLLTLTDDPHARTRAYALRELGNRKEQSLAPVFENALRDDDLAVRTNAEWALGQLK